MYDRRFFRSKLGQAAMISIAAMVGCNVVALGQQAQSSPVPLASATQNVELA